MVINLFHNNLGEKDMRKNTIIQVKPRYSNTMSTEPLIYGR